MLKKGMGFTFLSTSRLNKLLQAGHKIVVTDPKSEIHNFKTKEMKRT